MPPPVPPTEPHHHETNHLLHLVLTLLTCGVWLFVWPCVWLVNELSNSANAKRYEEAKRQYVHHYWMWQHQQGR